MKTAYGFTRLDNLNEFNDWLNKQTKYNYTGIQIHHTWLPEYKNFYKADGSHEDELVRQKNTKDFHVNTNHWGNIAQHFTIFPNGVVVTGRPLSSTTAIGIKGWNSNKICIEIYGNFDKGHDIMKEEQKNAVIGVYALLCKKFGIAIDASHLRCHCWFTAGGTYLGGYSANKSAKTCPGTNFTYSFGGVVGGLGNSREAIEKYFFPQVKAFKLNGTTQPVQSTPTKQTTTTTKPSDDVKALQTALNKQYGCKLAVDGYYGSATKAECKKHYLKKGMYGSQHVKWMQQALKDLGYKLDVDGDFGNGTLTVVKQFQKDNKLTVDGYFGESSHTKIVELLKKKISNPTYVKSLGKCVISQYGTWDGSEDIGCTGLKLKENYHCASHNLPCGTKVYIPALKGVINDDGIFEVQDTGGCFFDFDIYTSIDKANKIGKQFLDVHVISWGKGKITASYTTMAKFLINANRWSIYTKAWEIYKANGVLLDFLQYNDEDKDIRKQDWF